MLYAYLFGAIAGGLLLGASLLSDGEHAAHGGDSHPGDAHDGENHHDALGPLLSLRFWTYVLAFGGLAGLGLRWLVGLREPLAALAATAAGLGAGFIARTVVTRLRAHEAGGALDTRTLVGRSAQVLVPFAGGTTGKVRVEVGGRTVDLLATTDEAPLAARDEVLIVDVRDGATAHVARVPGVHADGSS